VVVTNRGCIVHPDADEGDIEFLGQVFKVPVLPGTANFGISFVRMGVVANSKGAIVGEETRGPEIVRIQMALGGGK
jgi:translation initiation factor 6